MLNADKTQLNFSRTTLEVFGQREIYIKYLGIQKNAKIPKETREFTKRATFFSAKSFRIANNSEGNILILKRSGMLINPFFSKYLP